MLEVFIVIAGAIQLATLIVFFVMAGNIAKIKNRLENTDTDAEQYVKMAAEEKYIGNKEGAREYLLRAKYKAENSIARLTSFPDRELVADRIESREKIIALVNAELAALD